MYYSTLFAFSLLATQQLVAGHGAIVKAVGDAGGEGSAIGIDASTPRDGTRRNPFQADSTRFQGEAAGACGETIGAGANDPEAGTKAVMAAGSGTLPQVTQGGELMMTLHQVNGDGAGPYTCMIDSTGTGAQWEKITVTQNLQGNERGRNNDGAETDFPLNVAIPADQECTGSMAGQDNLCMVRCQNPARAGPFGGCVPIQMVTNTTVAATDADATTEKPTKKPSAAAADADATTDGDATATDGDAEAKRMVRSAKFVITRRASTENLQPFEIEEEMEELDAN